MKEEIKKLIERKQELERSKEFIKEKKKELPGIINSLVNLFKSGRLSREEYDERLKKSLKNKSAEEWNKQYDESIAHYDYQIRLCDRLIKKEKYSESGNKRIKLLSYLIFIVLIGLIVSLVFTLMPFGFNVFKKSFEKISNLGINSVIGTKSQFSVEENNTIRIIKNSDTIVDENTIQYAGAIGEKIRWESQLRLDKKASISVELPYGADEINIIQDSIDITGSVDSSVKRDYVLFGNSKIELKLNNGINYKISFKTPAPIVDEIPISNGKKVIVHGRDDIHYKDILTSSKINENLKIDERDKIKIYEVKTFNGEEIREQVDFNAIDSDYNGLIEKVEWITSSLSDAVFEIYIIEVTKASHLDSNKEFISDIYDSVSQLDNNWSEHINNNEYVRVVFERELSSSRDITFYVRNSENKRTKIEVYKNNSDEKITEFPIIENEGYYKILLTEMQGSSDSFDLKIVNLDNDNSYLEFDHIIDPAVSYNLSFTNPTPSNNTFTINKSVLINLSILNAPDLRELNFNWNNTNFTIYNDSLIGMYNFDNRSSLGENATIFVDVSRYFNNGSCSGTACPTFNSTGKYNRAYSFDGVDDYISLGNKPSFDFINSFTISVWVYRNKIQQSPDSAIISKIRPNGIPNYDGYMLWYQNSTNLTHLYINNGVRATGTIKIPDSQWTHIVGLWNGTYVKTYVNGKLDGQGGYASVPLSSGFDFLIGKYTYTSARAFTGLIDEVRIWNRSLTDQEVYEQYVSNLQKFNQTQWYLYINQSKNATNGLDDGNYNYYASARDLFGNYNQTETRIITIGSLASQLLINFTNPTPANNTFTTDRSLLINVSILNDLDLRELNFNWNRTNYSFYDNSLVGMWSFDNKESLGDSPQNVTDLSRYGNKGSLSSMYNILDSMDSTSGWLSFEGMGTISVNNINFKQGTGALNLNKSLIDRTDTYIQKNLASPVDLRNKSVGVWLYIKDSPTLNKISGTKNIRIFLWNSTTSNEYKAWIFPKSNLHVGWNLITIDTSIPPLSDTGASLESIKRIRFDVETESNLDTYSNGDIIVDEFYYTSWTSFGKYNGAYRFDGVDDYIKVDNSSSLKFMDNITFSAWIYTNYTEGDPYQRVIGKYYWDQEDFGSWIMYFMPNPDIPSNPTNLGYLDCIFNVTNEWIVVKSLTKIPINQWTYVTCSYNGSNAILYVNSDKYVSNTVFGKVGTSNFPIIIGATSDGINLQNNFKGSIDEVRIWNRSLTDQEVYEQYVSNLQKFNQTQWYLYINQSKNATNGLDDGNYNYYASARDLFGNYNQTETRIININSSIFKINNINYSNSVYPVAGGIEYFTVNFTVIDSLGNSDINLSSAIVNATRNSISRYNNTCYSYVNDAVSKNFSCTIGMNYFDSPGNWRINISISSYSRGGIENASNYFDYKTLFYPDFIQDAINWSNVILGSSNVVSDNNLSIRNLGNTDIFNITINATKLVGESDGSRYISIENFSVNISNPCIGTSLAESQNVTIRFLVNYSLSSQITPASENLMFCLKSTEGFSVQSYSSSRNWIINALQYAFASVVIRRRKKLKLIERKLRKEGISLDELLEIAKDRKIFEIIKEEKIKRDRQKILIPVEIFREENSAGVLCKYLEETLGLRFSEIARLINRDQRTVWINCNNNSIDIEITRSSFKIPIEIFSDRRLSILEAVVKYMKENGYRNYEISEILDKDQRVIGTLYSRVKRKIKEEY